MFFKMKNRRDSNKISRFASKQEKITLYQLLIVQNNRIIQSNLIFSPDKKKNK
jgi:hypothetical protein